MNKVVTEDKKIKTQIIPAIHNTVSLQAYLKTENGEPIANQEVLYKIVNPGDRKDKVYTNEEGKVHLTLNLLNDTTIELIYEGNEKYEKTKITTFRVKPSQEEIDIKNNHPVQVKKREENEKKQAEVKKRKEERKIKRVEEFEESQNQLEIVGDDNIAIELKNVSLSFKIGNDKIDNLKEYVIRTLNRTKEKIPIWNYRT